MPRITFATSLTKVLAIGNFQPLGPFQPQIGLMHQCGRPHALAPRLAVQQVHLRVQPLVQSLEQRILGCLVAALPFEIRCVMSPLGSTELDYKPAPRPGAAATPPALPPDAADTDRKSVV